MGDALFSLLASPIVVSMVAVDALKRRAGQLRAEVEAKRDRRDAEEALLDAKAIETRATILRLAEALGADAHEARKAMIRASFLASGELPTER